MEHLGTCRGSRGTGIVYRGLDDARPVGDHVLCQASLPQEAATNQHADRRVELVHFTFLLTYRTARLRDRACWNADATLLHAAQAVNRDRVKIASRFGKPVTRSKRRRFYWECRRTISKRRGRVSSHKIKPVSATAPLSL